MEEDKKEQNTESATESANAGTQNIAPNEIREENSDETENIASEYLKDVALDNTEQKYETVAEEQKAQSNQTVDEKKDGNIKSEKIYPNVVPGANVKIYQKIKEKKGKEEKERIQIFEGIVLARKGGNSAGATITVRKICKGGFEVKKIFPIHLPAIAKIEVLRQAKVRRAKLKFLNKDYKKKLKYKNTRTLKY